MEFLMLAELFVLCIVSSVTDFISGKIYNKLLFPGTAVALFLLLVYCLTHPQDTSRFLINIMIGALISFVLYKSKIWGAGDSKLWILVCILIPIEYYQENNYILYPSMNIFFYTFMIAYAYIILDTAFQYRIRKSNIDFTDIKKSLTKIQILNYLTTLFFVFDVYGIFQIIFRQYFFYNRLLFSLLFVLLFSKIYNNKIFKNRVVLCLLIVIYILLAYAQYGQNSYEFDAVPIAIFITLILIRILSSNYNYDIIQTKNVKQGLVLSRGSVLTFRNSRVVGLPKETDETTKYRISQNEAESIKRWEHSKYGRDTIVIVRHLPFAIFITLGVVSFILLKYL